MEFTFISLGSGPAGLYGALEATKYTKNIAVIESSALGGACLHTGTVPSKSLREGAIGGNWVSAQKRRQYVVQEEVKKLKEELKQQGIQFFKGLAKFSGPQELLLGDKKIRFQKLLLATGSSPNRLPEFPTHPKLWNSDSILKQKKLPKTLYILGAGVIGCEYASLLAAAGHKVMLIDRRKELLRGVEPEILTEVTKHFARQGISLALGAELRVPEQKNKTFFQFYLGKKTIKAQAALLCMGRSPNTQNLAHTLAGLKLDERQCVSLQAKGSFQTHNANIFAAGDCIGAPSLGAASMEQGKRAVREAFGIKSSQMPLIPCGIYTIPEIASVGLRSEELKNTPHRIGFARFKDTARGKMNQEDGLLKLLVDKNGLVLGAHMIGPRSSDLIHYAQLALQNQYSAEQFLDTCFNYPSYAELFKRAARDALDSPLRG